MSDVDVWTRDERTRQQNLNLIAFNVDGTT